MRFSATTAVLIVAAQFVVGAVPSSAGSECSGFSALAAADGARTEAVSRGLALVEQADAGVPAAQAVVNALGVSTGYAAMPWPGETVLGLTDPRAPYPLAVRSSYPFDPEASLENPAMSLTARSEQLSSSATARGGVASQGAPSAGRTQVSAEASCGGDGTVIAEAGSITEGLSFGSGVLRIGWVHAVAKVVVAGGKPSVSSNLQIEQVSVGGQSVAVGEGGPAALLGDDGPLAGALRDAGITVTVLASSHDDDGNGVVAPALEIRTTREGIGPEPTVLTHTFGRARARALTSVGDETSFDGGTATTENSDMYGPGHIEPAVEPTPDTGMPVVAGSTASAAASPRERSRPVDSAASPPSHALSLGSAARSPAVVGFSFMSMYLVLAAVAAALGGGGLVLRVFGVKLAGA